MRNRHLRIFIYIFIISLLLGVVLSKHLDINEYDALITFLSMIVGFEIASLSIIFNSPLKKTLYDKSAKYYRTELHRLRDLYRFSIYISLFYIIVIFLTPDFCWDIKGSVKIQKDIIVYPILLTSTYCTSVLCKDLFNIFVYPTNDK